MNWNSTFIEDINQRRTQERERAPEMAQREDNLLKLVSRSLYGEKVHYALELIQNAEDAHSTFITFIFEKGKVIVVNDGDVFTPDDVDDGICSVKPGRKENKIGFFGVGFKSVFNITNAPQVISADFNFEIENYIYPKPCTSIPQEAKAHYNQEKGSIFILPQSKDLPTIPELIENFKEIDDKILLFLPELRKLHFIDRINDEKWTIEKPEPEGDIQSLVDGRTGQTTKWRVFHKDLPASEQEVSIPEGKEGITDTRILIAFPYDEATKEANKGSTVYCYLPTNKRSDMPFLVQADFVPTVGRGNIQDVEWNKWLLGKLGELAADAAEQVKDDQYLGKELYSFIPLKDKVQEPLMNILSDAMYGALQSKNIARTLSHEWKRPDECAIAIHPEITKIIFQQDLKHLFGKPLSYADVELSEKARQILTELGSSVLGETEFIEFLAKEDLIKNRKPGWFLKVYAYLREVFDVTNTYYNGSFAWEEEKLQLFSELQKIKFILTNKGSLVSLKDPQRPDRLICYPQRIDLSEVNELFTEGEIVFLNPYFQLSTITRRKQPDPDEEEKRKKAHEFFKGVGVKIYFKQSHVIREVIVPKYSNGKYEEYDDLKLYKLINYIRMYWPTLESEVKNKKISEEVFDEIRQAVLLKAYTKKNGEKVPTYIHPSHIYFPKRYARTALMEELFEGLEDIYFLHPYYLNKEKNEQRKKKRGRQRAEYGWKKFVEILGVWSSPRVEKEEQWVSIKGKPEYDWVKREYSTSGLHEISGDSFSAEVQEIIEYCSTLNDDQAVRQRMTILWDSLSDNWNNYKSYCSASYKYYYRKEQYKRLYCSSFLDYLRKSKWIPTVEEDFSKPKEVFIDNKRNRFLLGDTVKFVNLDGNLAFLRDIGVNIEPSIKQVVRYLKDYKENNSSLLKGKFHKFEEIYRFFAEKTEEQDLDKEETLQELRKEFDKNELLYIPRKDRPWWKPSLVFWRDFSRTFGPLRGYVEHEEKEIYSSEIKSFLFSLGVSERPSIRQALEVLEELKEQNDVETLKKIVTKVYSYISELIGHGHAEQLDWQEYSFLTKNEHFSHPMDTFFDDNEEFSKNFYGKVAFIDLPFSSWVKLVSFLAAASFKSFSKNLSIKKYLGEISEVEGDQALSIIKVLSLVKPYLLSKNLEAYERLESEGIFDNLEEMEIYEASEIKLDLFLKKDESETITVSGVEKEAYHSKEENRLYILKGTNLLSGTVGKEISRIFKGSEDDVFLFLSSVLSKADDEEDLERQLQLLGIEEESYSGPGTVELLPEEEKAEDREEEKKEEQEKEKKEEEEEKPSVKPPEPEMEKKPKGLIDPDEYYPATSKEFAPYKKIEGDTPNIIKEIKLKEGKPGDTKPPKEKPPRTGTTDAETTALRTVINHENGEGREAEDRHKQKGIGYDIYSKKADGEEMFIEVKHFSEQEGKFKLKPHQIEKAKKGGDKYYVYIVTGLKKGVYPKKLFIIQNPLKWLTPDAPIEEEYSGWKNAVKNEFELEKA